MMARSTWALVAVWVVGYGCGWAHHFYLRSGAWSDALINAGEPRPHTSADDVALACPTKDACPGSPVFQEWINRYGVRVCRTQPSLAQFALNTQVTQLQRASSCMQLVQVHVHVP